MVREERAVREEQVSQLEPSPSKNVLENLGGARESLSKVNTLEPCQRSITKAYSIQGNTIDRDVKQNGGGISDNVSHTLNSVDRHGVATAIRLDNGSAQPIGGVEVSPTIRQGAGPNGCANVAVASVDCRNGTENENVNVTLQAKANGGQSLNCGIVIREKHE